MTRSTTRPMPTTLRPPTTPCRCRTTNSPKPRKLHGRKAEVLDAFVFGATDVGAARVSGRLGRHTVLWGESLFFGNNAIAGTQSPVDAIKASSVPGSTTKEILMPVGQASGQVQLLPALTLM